MATRLCGPWCGTRYAAEGRFRIVGETSDIDECVQLVRTWRPDVVLMDLDLPNGSGAIGTRILTEQFPEVAVVVISRDQDFDQIRSAMTAGAKEFIGKPFQKEGLLEVLDRTVTRHEKRKASLTRAHELPAEGIWCFLRGTGGVGQTSLILSMATELLQLKRSVLVVDLEQLFGNAAFYLGMEVHPLHLGDAIENAASLDKKSLEAYVKRHPTGIELLAPPTSTLDAHQVPMDKVAALLPLLKDFADYVLIDMPAGLPEQHLPFLDEARYVFLCSDSTYGAAKNLGVLLGLMEVLEYPMEKLVPLVLKDDRDPERVREIRALAEMKGTQIRAWIPWDGRAAALAVRKADTLTRVSRRSPYTLAIQELLAEVLDLPRRETPSGFFARLASMISG
jgi:pilus assembly protein CpaE